MFIGEIHLWLQSNPRNYEVGVSLYSIHGKSQTFKKVFAQGKTVSSEALLKKELEKLAGELPVGPPSRELSTPKITADKKDGHHEITYPERLANLDSLRKKLWGELNSAYGLMVGLDESQAFDEARKGLAATICRNEELIDTIWMELDHFARTGEELPPLKRFNLNSTAGVIQAPDELGTLSESQLLKKRLSLRSYASELRRDNKLEALESVLARIKQIDDLLDDL